MWYSQIAGTFFCSDSQLKTTVVWSRKNSTTKNWQNMLVWTLCIESCSWDISSFFCLTTIIQRMSCTTFCQWFTNRIIFALFDAYFSYDFILSCLVVTISRPNSLIWNLSGGCFLTWQKTFSGHSKTTSGFGQFVNAPFVCYTNSKC